MNKIILAVSGGVDSVVLLDMLANQPKLDIIVAHFDHGIRSDSAEDTRFVESLAKMYGLAFETRREELGPEASEELARDRRYSFLRSLAKKYKAHIVTAHHSDDVVESILINLYRGTGWRGLAVMDSDVLRPIWAMSKKDIIAYAKKHNLVWREDSTNSSDSYLRNRFRRALVGLSDDEKQQLLALWVSQKDIKFQIEAEVNKLVPSSEMYDRYFFIYIDDSSALECLRCMTKGLLTRPQLLNLLIAIKTLPANREFNAGSFVKVSFTSRNFMIKLLK